MKKVFSKTVPVKLEIIQTIQCRFPSGPGRRELAN